MTSRVYHVCPDKDKFRIQLRTIYANASKRKLVELRGYPCANSANNDVTRLIKFFQSGKSRITEFVQCYTALSNCRNLAVKADYTKTIDKVNGVIRKNQHTKMCKEYNSYKKIMISWRQTYLPMKEWSAQNQKKGFDQERFIRRYYRDPQVIQASISRGLLSKDDKEIIDSYKASIHYFTERLGTLNEQASQCLSIVKTLRSAIYSATTFTLLMKAEFEDEPEDEFKDVIDLSDDDEFTATNTSKLQLTRSIQQCQLVEKVYHLMTIKVASEMSLVRNVLAEITALTFNPLKSVESIQQHWNLIKEFKITHSVENIVSEVSVETDQLVSTKTILKWYREFKKYKMFKEDIRGCHLRRFVLEEYGLQRPFELFLKNERHLTVDVARIQLESLIRSHALKHPDEDVNLIEAMLPLHNRSVHRWMLKCGCKYEKATVSYYTDSHEAEATKKDFKER
jgi:hypothetical protein